jgi:predicted O-methyltransferase YrrM
VLAKTRQGGSILIDNVLWKGKVLDLQANKDKKTQALHAFNEMVTKDSRVENVLLPLRDGLMWVMKK